MRRGKERSNKLEKLDEQEEDINMSQVSSLLFIKAIATEITIRSIRQVEQYTDTHNVELRVEIEDEGVRVYDAEKLLLTIPVELR